MMLMRLALRALAVLAFVVTFGTNAFADSDYRLGEGDVVRLTIYQRPDLSVESRLGTQGRLYVPGGGKINLEGVSISDAEAQIAQMLAHTGAAPNAQVDLQVVTFGARKVSVFGYVGKPGAYSLDRTTKLSELIAEAGGISPEGSHQVILLRRNGPNSVNRMVVNLQAIIADGQTSADPEVQGGDIVTVERAPRVYVYGAVNRPGAYNVEKGMTALEMISLAGGLAPTGSDGRLEVVRHGENGKARSLKVGLQDELLPEDVLIVHESIF
jgi:polysaccharide biosynthesis/export protein